jgi:hypothetical protein
VTHTPASRSDAASVSDADIDAFYNAAALGLAWIDARESTPRRFGSAADASWRNYAGTPSDLTPLDRLELLLRDAASLYPDAFSPRVVFSLAGLTDDEPFGQWSRRPNDRLASDHFRAPPSPGASVRELLTNAARTWSIALGAAAPLPPIGPTTRVLVVGAAALVAVAARFADNRDLSFHEQVYVVGDEPALRHLAGLAALALGELRGPRCLSVELDGTALAALGVDPFDVLAGSDDADANTRAVAEAWLAAHHR